MYPIATRAEDFLHTYAEQLPAVELNTSFYRLPSEEQFAHWAAQTPPGFRFAVKAPGFAQGLPRFYERLQALGDRLGVVLLQVPKAKRDDALLDRLLGSMDPIAPHAVELRHTSWDAPEIDERISAAGAARVGSLEGAAPFRYLRRRDPPWSDAELLKLAADVRPLREDGIDVWCIFNRGETPDHAPGGEPTAATALRLLELSRSDAQSRRSAPSRSRGRPRGRS